MARELVTPVGAYPPTRYAVELFGFINCVDVVPVERYCEIAGILTYGQHLDVVYRQLGEVEADAEQLTGPPAVLMWQALRAAPNYQLVGNVLSFGRLLGQEAPCRDRESRSRAGGTDHDRLGSLTSVSVVVPRD